MSQEIVETWRWAADEFEKAGAQVEEVGIINLQLDFFLLYIFDLHICASGVFTSCEVFHWILSRFDLRRSCIQYGKVSSLCHHLVVYRLDYSCMVVYEYQLT